MRGTGQDEKENASWSHLGRKQMKWRGNDPELLLCCDWQARRFFRCCHSPSFLTTLQCLTTLKRTRHLMVTKKCLHFTVTSTGRVNNPERRYPAEKKCFLLRYQSLSSSTLRHQSYEPHTRTFVAGMTLICSCRNDRRKGGYLLVMWFLISLSKQQVASGGSAELQSAFRLDLAVSIAITVSPVSAFVTVRRQFSNTAQ